MNELVFRNSNGVPMTTSMLVAETFCKEHRHVVRDIDNLICNLQDIDFQCCPNLAGVDEMFVAVEKDVQQPNGGVKKTKSYIMDRNGFSLLAMGYNGKKALTFKLKYMDAFMTMENIIRGNANEKVKRIETDGSEDLRQRVERLERILLSNKGRGVIPSTINPEEEPTIDDLYPWEGVVTTYRKLRMQYPKHITVMQASDLLRLRGIVIRKSSLFRFLRESGLISGKNSTYHRPSPECVKKGWMVCMSGRRVSVYPNRHYYTPYLSPEFLDILERKLSAQGVKALELWKEVQP